MKIGINAFGCEHGKSGIGSYVYSLVNNLPKINGKIEIFGPELDRYTYTSNLETVQYEGVPIDDTEFSETIWHKTAFNAFANKHNYDAILFPKGLQLLPVGRFVKPSFLVIQEIINLTNKSFLQSFSNLPIKLMLKKATGIIASTKFIKTNLVNSGIPEHKIKVIYNGIDTNIFYPREINENEAASMQPFAIRRPYIIYASRISEPEKHHIELIEGFSIFKQKTKFPHRLVIAGAEGKNANAVHRAVMDSPVSSDILLTGYIEHEKLANLYIASDLSIFPSTVEGVGLPVIEAMACGIPTACANASALPEITGNASHYFDPTKPSEIANAIEKLTSSKTSNNYRAEIIQKASEWVKQYNWKKTSQETFNYIFENLKQ